MANKEWLRVAKYGLVGVANTGVDFAVFAALVYGFGVMSGVAQIVSYGCGVVNSFWLNRRWTFRVQERANAGEWVRFMIVNALSFACATGVLLGLEHGLGFAAWAAKLVSVGASLAVNYTGTKLWVFRDAQPARDVRR
ncbi:GtrA family protein [Cohnella algarum]|uniref:GtrA family protein n=1 Tax=Cohnella algarum TaxID=2044859 RepID=UPI001967B920|nr:GtrA family protein [Cohnella algarum]MBN2982857.1 GtrA family protein [Cohnella algarum]